MKNLGAFLKIGFTSTNNFSLPAYELIALNDGYETRKYQKTKFVSTKYRIVDNSNAVGKSSEFKAKDAKRNYDLLTKNLMKLMRFTQGENELKLRMRFLMPVFVHLEKINEPAELEEGQCILEISILISLPKEYQFDALTDRVDTEPPEPLDNSIKFVIQKPWTCFVRKLRGFVNDEGFKEERSKLIESINKSQKDRMNVNTDKLMCISYDLPYKLFNRRNEIWLYSTRTD